MRAFHLTLCMIVWIASEAQNTYYLPDGQYHPDVRYVLPVTGAVPDGIEWANSYSVGDRCYCVWELKDGIAEYPFESPEGWMAVKDICAMLGNGPGVAGNPIYNDVQCGNGPSSNEANEHTCPGRVDIGKEGCGQIGPKWNFSTNSTQDMFFRDCGASNEGTLGINGTSWTYTAPTTVAVKGTSQPDQFRSHRSGPNFSYLIQGLVPNGRYKVSLGYAEVWLPNCQTGKRVQSVQINDMVVNDRLDVFNEAGCATAYVESNDVSADGLGRILITMKAIQENAMLSTIKIVASASRPQPPAPVPLPPTLAKAATATDRSRVPAPVPPPKAVVIDAGSSSENLSFVAAGTWTYDAAPTAAIKGTTAPAYFRTHRLGKSLRYTVPGFIAGASYTVTLGFAETWQPNCANGKRIMSIKLNNIVVSSNLDVFREVGCETAYMETHVATADEEGEFTLEIGASVDTAMISYISIVLAPGWYFLDTGAIGDNIAMVQGTTSRYGDPDTPEIGGTRIPVPFRTHRFGSDFKYIIQSGFTPGIAYKVYLGFSEIFTSACSAGARKFSIVINGQTVESGLDVVGTTGGCNKALVKVYTFKANAQGKFEIAFKAIVNNAMVSFIAVNPE